MPRPKDWNPYDSVAQPLRYLPVEWQMGAFVQAWQQDTSGQERTFVDSEDGSRWIAEQWSIATDDILRILGNFRYDSTSWGHGSRGLPSDVLMALAAYLQCELMKTRMVKLDSKIQNESDS